MHKKTIGQTAGKVWSVLGAQGRIALTTLPKMLDEEVHLVQQAVGWLAREDKVEFEKQGRALYVKLSPDEAESYRRSNGKGV